MYDCGHGRLRPFIIMCVLRLIMASAVLGVFSVVDGKRFHFSETLDVSLLWPRPSWERGSGGGGTVLCLPRVGITQIVAFLRMICSWGCLITRKNAGIVPLALYESQMWGLNHM